MGVTAIVMAGGRGLRMGLTVEKPLLRVGGKCMIEHVLEALGEAQGVEDIVVAVSAYTPKTAELVERLSLKVLETPGDGYVSDAAYAIRKLGLGTVLTVSADLPLVTREIIDRVLGRYVGCGKPALTVAVPVEVRERLGLVGGFILEKGGRRLVPAGINVVDGRRIDEGELEEEIYVVDEEEVAVNVNTPLDLRVVEQLFAKSCRRD